jgi:LmbE family N-acetylglucosaminyl deacetylase
MAGKPYWVPKQYGYYSTYRLWYEKPSFIVDITDYWDKKIDAIKAYRSQNKNMASAKTVSLLEKVEITCRYLGHCIGTKYGEAFVSYEPIGVGRLEFLADL